jgi:hypothetical protein
VAAQIHFARDRGKNAGRSKGQSWSGDGVSEANGADLHLGALLRRPRFFEPSFQKDDPARKLSDSTMACRAHLQVRLAKDDSFSIIRRTWRGALKPP